LKIEAAAPSLLVVREWCQGEREAGSSHPPTHVLLTSGDAGAPARAIQELAGHQDLATTQRYVHLSPAALDVALRLLETGSLIPWRNDGGGGKIDLKSSIS
jgi:integrase